MFPNKPELMPDGEVTRVAYPPRDLALWRSHLHHGVPLVVTGCTEGMQHKYGPQYFVDHAELDTITVVSIQGGVHKVVSASAFFTSVLAGDDEAAKYKVKVNPANYCSARTLQYSRCHRISRWLRTSRSYSPVSSRSWNPLGHTHHTFVQTENPTCYLHVLQTEMRSIRTSVRLQHSLTGLIIILIHLDDSLVYVCIRPERLQLPSH